ncbi:MAG: hypothetical protein Q7W45_06120 [Bacteroidota bacterium]|nr:hypothetical protein [Bacteroidota bacterium]MDP3145024.1 hypothetical protein [Bacteroidota bacterium]MDP3556056.1 hypothetical protein [Bacteroidota bacterium]
MKWIIFNLYFLLIALNFHAQEKNDFFYFQTCYNISKTKKIDKEVEKYFKAIGKLQPKVYIYFSDIAYYYLERQNYNKAYLYMVKAIEHGLSFEMTRDFEINNFDEKHKLLIQKKFLENRSKTINYFYTHGSGDLMKFLFIRDLFTSDQTARQQLDFAGYKNKTAWNYIGYVDSLNMDTLVKFIKAFGMVNESNVGGDALLNILLLHLKRYDNEYLDSCIKDNCAKHLLHPDFYTLAIDQALKEGSTLYGTFDITDTTIFLDIKNLDSLRNSVGLASLYEQSLYQTFNLPKNYIIPDNLKRKYEKFLLEIERKTRK